MKLTRQTTNDCKSSYETRSHHWGRKHYFIIENASAAELKAIDDLLRETDFADCCDGCPCYEDNFGCGWWIEISEVPEFKAAYQKAKSQVADRVTRNMAQNQGDTLDAMTTTEEVETVARVATKIARELRSRQESISALRAIGTHRPIMMNPYYNSYCKLSQQGWELIHAVLMVGTVDEVIGWLYCLEKNCEASAARRPDIAKLMKTTGCSYDVAHKAIRAANNRYDEAFKAIAAAQHAAEPKPEPINAEQAHNHLSQVWNNFNNMRHTIDTAQASIRARFVDADKAICDAVADALEYTGRDVDLYDEMLLDACGRLQSLIPNIPFIPDADLPHAAEPQPMTAEETAVDTFINTRESQYPGADEVKIEGEAVYRLNGGEWIELYRGAQAQAVFDKIAAWLKSEMEYHLAQQKLEQKAEQRAEEHFQGFYHGGGDDYPNDWDHR